MPSKQRLSVSSLVALVWSILALRQTIGAKIFGLAVFQQLLIIVMVGFLLPQAAITNDKMETIVALDLPLAQAVVDIDEFGLRRRLAFERWFGALNATNPDAEIIADASAKYVLFDKKLTISFKTAEAMLDRYPSDMTDHRELVEVRALLKRIEAAFVTVSARQLHALDLQRARQTTQANAFVNQLRDLQNLLQDDRAAMKRKTNLMIVETAKGVRARQQRLMQVAVGTTILAFLLGLALAALITVRMTRSLRSLKMAMEEAERGRLDAELPVTSRDEIGSLTQAFNFFIREQRAKEQLKRTFGKYIDPRVLEQLLNNKDAVAADGGRRVMSVLFADIKGFTAISERLTPSVMVSLLNRHFGLQAQAIQAHQGVVDKFIGDAVMAFWGPPFTDAHAQAALACRSALAQMAALDSLRHELPEITGLRKDAPMVDLRIGISTGDVVVGNIGSENTRSYTVIGDTVNLASRIESANRLYGTRILLSEETAHAAGAEFALREIDNIEVKGKVEVTRIFELLGMSGELPATVVELSHHYAEALRCYRVQDWDEAESQFRLCLELNPDNGPARVMLDRLPALRTQALPSDWSGVFSIARKMTIL